MKIVHIVPLPRLLPGHTDRALREQHAQKTPRCFYPNCCRFAVWTFPQSPSRPCACGVHLSAVARTVETWYVTDTPDPVPGCAEVGTSPDDDSAWRAAHRDDCPVRADSANAWAQDCDCRRQTDSGFGEFIR